MLGTGGGGGLLIWAAPVQWAEKDIRLIMSLQGESCQRRVANRVAPLIPEAAAASSASDDDDDDDAAAELLRRRCAFFFLGEGVQAFAAHPRQVKPKWCRANPLAWGSEVGRLL